MSEGAFSDRQREMVRRFRELRLPEEERLLREDGEFYLECLRGVPLSERESTFDARQGLILFGVYLRRRGAPNELLSQIV